MIIIMFYEKKILRYNFVIHDEQGVFGGPQAIYRKSQLPKTEIVLCLLVNTMIMLRREKECRK